MRINSERSGRPGSPLSFGRDTETRRPVPCLQGQETVLMSLSSNYVCTCIFPSDTARNKCCSSFFGHNQSAYSLRITTFLLQMRLTPSLWQYARAILIPVSFAYGHIFSRTSKEITNLHVFLHKRLKIVGDNHTIRFFP